MAINLNGCAINKDFCPNKNFRDKVIALLNGNLFVDYIPGIKTSDILNSIYDAMTVDINTQQYILYPLYGDPLDTNISKVTLSYPQTGTKRFNVWAGHDLPVWIGDPAKADIKLMIVGQDPRRKQKEMQSCGLGQTDGISISTPFGLHSYEWRSDEEKGLIHYVVYDLYDYLLSAFPNKNMSVYYTDIYKLRGVDPNSTRDVDNLGIYESIFLGEMKLFKPDIVLLLGKPARNTFDSVCKGTPSITVMSAPPSSGAVASTWKISLNGKPITVISVPHPSGTAARTWKSIGNTPKRRFLGDIIIKYGIGQNNSAINQPPIP